MLTSLLVWLEETPPSVWIREYPSVLGFPFILFLHTLGLAMLAAISVAIDVWLLRQQQIGRALRMTGVIRVMWLGLGINAVSGLALLLAYPAKALTNPVFYFKLLLVVIGVYAAQRINNAVFPRGLAVTGAVPLASKRWAIVSIVVWAGAIVTGRLLAYTNEVLFAYELL